VGVALAAVAAPAGANAETLFDAIALATQTNPGLRGEQEEVRAVDEGYVQARSAYGPQISLSGQVTYDAARVEQPASFFAPAGTTHYGAATGSAYVSLTQELYTAGATNARVRGAVDNILAGRETLRQTESQLILNVVTAYLDVRRDRQSVQLVRDEIAALTADLDEIKAKGALLVVSKTDVAQAEARRLAAETQLSQTLGRLHASEAEYLDVVGQTPGELAREPDLLGIPASVDGAFESADHNNPQILAAIQQEAAAREAVRAAKSAFGPTVSLKLDAGVAPIAPYLVRQYDKSATAAVVFDQPIFTSGLNQSKVRQAADEDAKAALRIEETRRGVVQQVSQAWAELVTARDATTLEERQVAVERIAVEGNRIEERAGLRTTIDLLNAESELTSSQIALVQNRHDEYLARTALLAGMGLLEVRYLMPAAQTYDPALSLKRVERRVPVLVAPTASVVDNIAAPSAPEQHLSPPGAGATTPDDLPPLPTSEP
jgi:outer membrane protein